MDVISEALQQVRLTGAVLFRVGFGAPWAVQTGGDVRLPPPATHTSVFHAVLEGECWVGHGDEPRRRLQAGEAVIIPRSIVHYLGDTPDRSPAKVSDLLNVTSLSKLRDLRWGGDGRRTRILCGFLGYERAMFTPLYDALPDMFQVRLAGGDAEPTLDPLLAYAEDEIVSRRPGSTGLRLRMAELLFVEALRRYMAGLPDDEPGWLAGVRDPLVGRALALLHARPREAWTVATLAREVASSRSALADRFQALLAEPPMHYLARLRMQLAARRLRDSRDSVEAIADAVGYASTAAFQRAFKREMGTTPARWRRMSAPG